MEFEFSVQIIDNFTGEGLVFIYLAAFLKESSVRIMMPIFVFAPPNIAPSEIMRRIKGKCSMKLFESFPDLKKAIVGATFLGKRLLLRHFWRIDRRED